MVRGPGFRLVDGQVGLTVMGLVLAVQAASNSMLAVTRLWFRVSSAFVVRVNLPWQR